MMRTLWVVGLLCGALLLSGCSRDFALPETDFAIQGATLTPGIAREGVSLELEVRTVGPTPTAVSARILGGGFVDGGLGPDGSWRLSYPVTGREPEGVEVRVDIEATSEEGPASAIVWAEFDFQAPRLVQVVQAASLLSADGEGTEVDLIFDQELAGAPQVSALGRELACAPVTREGWRCAVAAEAQDPAGWISAEVKASDPAGNQLATTAELGVAIDRASAPAALALALISQDPSPATALQQVVLVLEASLPLSAPPAVVIAARPAPCEVRDPSGRQFHCLFEPRRGDLGFDGGEGPAELRATATSAHGEEATLLAEVILDLLGPQVTNLSATRTRVLADEQVTFFLTFHEPVEAADFSLQGRDLSCAYTAPDAAICDYQTTGNELGGAQVLQINAMDRLGNSSLQQLDAGVIFDFACEQLASRAFVLNSSVRPTSFLAEPGVFEPGSSLELALFEGAAPIRLLTVAADGSVPETILPASVERFVWFRATDADGHTCPWARSSQRFVSEYAPTAEPYPINSAIPLVAGIRAMSLSSYTDDRGLGTRPPALTPAELVSLSADDGATITVAEGILPPVAWTNHGDLPGAPLINSTAPLAWDPANRSVIRYWVSSTYAQINWWDGAAWSFGGIFAPRPSPAEYAWGTASSSTTANLYIYGGIGGGPPIDDFLVYDGFDLQPVTSSSHPTGRIYPGLTYLETTQQLLLFGGTEIDSTGNPATNGETLVWDGTLWMQMRNSLDPPGRYGASLVTDLLRGPAYLFGGRSQGVALEDTWSFDGLRWQQASPTISPSARYLAGAAYHGGLEELVVFGGLDQADQELSDLWTFDGSEWSELSLPGGPPAVFRPGVAYDFLRGALVVYGGWLASGNLSRDLWELGPTARYPQALFRLQLPAFVEASSVATLSITARGTASRPGGPEEGLEVELWDDLANQWRPLTLPVANGATGSLRRYEVPMNEEILSRHQSPWAFVLVRSRAPATEEGGATLEIDSVSLQIDTF